MKIKLFFWAVLLSTGSVFGQVEYEVPPPPVSLKAEVLSPETSANTPAIARKSGPPEKSFSPSPPPTSSYSENGENGLASVADNSSAAYSLLQSDFVGQGSNAFHLAGNSGDWFSLNQTITPQVDTKLFFLLAVRWATSAQIARVQVSTNGGGSWSQTIFSRPGIGTAGDGNFVLEEVDLSAFSGQSIQIRFLYDFTGGSFFPQTTNSVGMFVDDIQVGSEYTKQLYSIGDPTEDEQIYLELINRSRADAAAEAQRLATISNSSITNVYNSRGIDTADIISQYSVNVSSGCMDQIAQPLAFNEQLLLAARLHSQDMFNNSFQGHTSSANPPSPLQAMDDFGQRLSRVGYTGYTTGSENVFSYSQSIEYGHAGFEVDWGDTTNAASACYQASFVGQGMQNPAGHRLAIHNGDLKEVGIGVINGSNGGVGPQVVTQDFGSRGGTFITGVVYQDLNGNNFLDSGEAVDGVRIDIDGAGYYATSATAGGYAIPVDGDGTYTIRFTGAGFADYTTTTTVSSGNNMKVDYQAVPSDGYYGWAASNSITGGPDGDHDNDGITNVVEYAVLSLDAGVSDVENYPKPVTDANGMTLSFTKDPTADDTAMIAEYSTDLINWVNTGYVVLADDANTYQVRMPMTAAKGFLRIAVSIVE